MIIGMLIFPDMTQLDFTGPYEVFAQLPGCEVKVIAQTSQPVAARGGLKFIPDATIDDAPLVAGEAMGAETAKTIQLLIEYNPAPPFRCGHPDTADAAIVENLRRTRAPMQAARLEQAKRAAGLYC